jgi:hypothetical protein
MKRLLLVMLFAAFAMPVMVAHASSEDYLDGLGRQEFLEDFGSNMGLSGLPEVECELRRAKIHPGNREERQPVRQLVRGS